MTDMLMKLAPWRAPDFAQLQAAPASREDGFKEFPTVSVRDLSQEALDALAGEWLGDLYTKAGKPSPWIAE